MKRVFFRSVFAVLVLALMLPHNSTFAATSTAVKTKILNHKGQKYVQLTGGIKSVTESINKELKFHAVAASDLNADLKKQNSNYSYTSTPSTKYNKNDKISVVVVDVMYTGGANGLYVSQTYNYDLRTGKLITLGDIAKTKDQISNLFVSVSAGLSQLQKAGTVIYDQSIFKFPVTPTSPFYFYDDGIVIQFAPNVVAPIAEGFVTVKVPYTALNAIPFTSGNTTQVTPPISSTASYIESQIDDEFEGYDEGNIYELSNGQIWKQVSYKYSYSYSYRPDVVIYKNGSKYYMIVDSMKDEIEVERLK